MAEQALYFLARARILSGDERAALANLLSLEALTARLDEDTYFKIIGRLFQGIAHNLLGGRETTIARYERVLAMKRWGSSHSSARRYLVKPYPAVE